MSTYFLIVWMVNTPNSSIPIVMPATYSLEQCQMAGKAWGGDYSHNWRCIPAPTR